MAVLVGKTTFADHISVEIQPGIWTDTFVYPISYKHGLFPLDYASAVRLLAPTLERMRKGNATIWVPVDAPPDSSGSWYYWYVIVERVKISGIKQRTQPTTYTRHEVMLA